MLVSLKLTEVVNVRKKHVLITPFFEQRPNFCTKFDPLNNFSVRRPSYHFKAWECKNLQAFNFLIIGQRYV